MKFLIVLFLILSSLLAFYASSVLSKYELDKLVVNGVIDFGPQPNVKISSYDFKNVHASFDNKVELKKISTLTKENFQNLILESLDNNSKMLLNHHLDLILDVSMSYQVDPFWVLSIMMLESHFENSSISLKNAKGLMQIKPETASHLYQLMNKRVSQDQIALNLFRSNENIEIGVFYMKKLLQNFRLNYKNATIAYNVGPNKLKTLIEDDLVNLDSFQYYLKVKENYGLLTRRFSAQFATKSSPFTHASNFGTSTILMLSDKDYITSLTPSVDSEILDLNSLHSLSF